MKRLTDAEVQERLARLPGWKLEGAAIQRVYQFKDFLGAMAFVNQLAELAEAAGHHPDIDIRYNKVTLGLTTHDAGGLTENDAKMAAQIGEKFPG
jgi:4a-hydroxytetrahydrobiopterin dehydratase